MLKAKATGSNRTEAMPSGKSGFEVRKMGSHPDSLIYCVTLGNVFNYLEVSLSSHQKY